MRPAILSILAILAIATGIAAASPAAQAKYLHPPCDCNDGGGGGNS
jgi:hypothetical protein